MWCGCHRSYGSEANNAGMGVALQFKECKQGNGVFGLCVENQCLLNEKCPKNM